MSRPYSKETTVPETYRFNVNVEIDVTNAESESEAREKAFSVMSTVPVARGRKASGPKAAITGVSIARQRDWIHAIMDSEKICGVESGAKSPSQPETTIDVTE
jgi:hypothetical protein